LIKNIFHCHKKIIWLNLERIRIHQQPGSGIGCRKSPSETLLILISHFQDEQQGWHQILFLLYGVSSDGRRTVPGLITIPKVRLLGHVREFTKSHTQIFDYFSYASNDPAQDLDPGLRQTKPNPRDASATLKTTLRTRNYSNSKVGK
jgi:hypothetical protein